MSFWLQGQFGSFSAVPSNPGWSFESSFYHARAAAGAGVSFARGGGFQAGMKWPEEQQVLGFLNWGVGQSRR